MNEASRADNPSLPLEAALRIDQLCDAFESALAEGREPRIEDLVAGLLEPAYGVLLRNLVALDVAYRQERGETPSPEEYGERFPERTELIRGAFADAQSGEQRASRRRLTHQDGQGPDTGIDSQQTGPELPASESEGHSPALVPPAGLPSIPGHEVLAVLGRGGMGVVYKARQVGLNRLVALKMVLAGDYASQEERDRFIREAELLAQLRHPNIVQIYQVGSYQGKPYFSLEFAEGGSLDRKLASTALPSREAASLLNSLALAVHEAHKKGIVHRDLKPANVLLTEDGTPKVTDFGLAKHSSSDLTASGAIMGTPSYMAPEQASGKSRHVGPATDVYSLGAILYRMLTGRPPFLGTSTFDTLDQVRTQEPVPPRKLQPKVPRDLERICLVCLNKDPYLRYPSALALSEDLQRFLRGEPIQAQRRKLWDRFRRWAEHPDRIIAAARLPLLLSKAFFGFAVLGVLGAGGIIVASDGKRTVLDVLVLIVASLTISAILAGVAWSLRWFAHKVMAGRLWAIWTGLLASALFGGLVLLIFGLGGAFTLSDHDKVEGLIGFALMSIMLWVPFFYYACALRSYCANRDLLSL
jgi:hypothetical protein